MTRKYPTLVIPGLVGCIIIVLLRNRVKHSSPVISNKDGSPVKAVYL